MSGKNDGAPAGAEQNGKSGGFSRRRFLKRAAIGLAGLAVGGAVDALAVEPRWVRLTRPVVRIPSLGRAWDGVRIAHLTDLHVGRLIGLDYVRKVVKLTLAESPDVIVLTGDYVSRTPAITPEYAAALKDLRAPLGQFAVLGNHDHWTDLARVQAMLKSAGISLLTNTHVLLRKNGDTLCLAGVGDLWEDKQRIERALGGVADEVPRILLSHNPDYAETMPASPRVDLMLCGHTHGGQVKIPFGPRPQLPIVYTKYAAGLNRGPHCPVYTSVGLGMVGIPVRFNCRPELPIITLKRS